MSIHYHFPEQWTAWEIAKVVYAIAALVGFIYSLFWVHQDAGRLGKPKWLVVVMVALSAWPLSLISWWVFRPQRPPAALPEETIVCLRCRSEIPSGQVRCAKCGWSYEPNTA